MNFFHKYHPEFNLRVSQLGNEAWEQGAVTLVINEFFLVSIYRGQKTVLSAIAK